MKNYKQLSLGKNFIHIGVVFFSLSLLFSCAIFSAIDEGPEAIIQMEKDMNTSLSNIAKKFESAAEIIDEEQEYYLGRATTAQILTRYKIDDNKDLTEYLNKICYTLIINSNKPMPYKGYYVAILDSDSINALSSPGGHILVTRGLLACCGSEDALAAVIAHEISHIQLKHATQAIKSSRSLEAVLATADTASTAFGTKKLSEISTGFGQSVDEVLTTLTDTGYSQQNEFEADKNALYLMADAGYNPKAMCEMLIMLDKKLGDSHVGFGKTHPKATRRLQRVNRELKKIDFPDDTTYARKARFNAIIK